MAIENGVAYGIRRFNKHRDEGLAPETANFRDALAEAIIDSVEEWFTIDEGGDDADNQ